MKMNRFARKFRFRFILLCLFALLTYTFLSLVPQESEGRPGGGSRFRSGRSRGGGGGSSGSSGGGVYYGGGGGVYVGPGVGIGTFGWVMIMLVLIVVVLYIYSRYNSQDEQTYSSAPTNDDLIGRKARVNGQVKYLIGNTDANFSLPLFCDFIQLFFTQWHQWRTRSEFMRLSPYVPVQMLEYWASQEKGSVQVNEVVIGSIDIMDVFRSGNVNAVAVEIDANYTEIKGGKTLRVRTLERWILKREVNVLSPNPEKMRALACPNCGNTLELNSKRECTSCGSAVQPGKQHWQLADRVIAEKHVSSGEKIGNYAEEVGTDFPTVFDRNLDRDVFDFIRRHGYSDMHSYWNTFSNSIVAPIYQSLLEAWTSLKWEAARPLITDSLFQTYFYQIELYKREGITPVMKDARLLNAELVKIESDKYYESITVRLYASGYDYLQDRNGKVVAGSARKERVYSEYWTFIRRQGTEKKESDFDPKSCPSCGAPVKMGQAGVCDYCGSKVTQGDFGWVLSRITQDESYFG